MGTFLGNLTVLGGCVEEVSALLPEATVGQWSERFVTALHEDYGMGTVDRPARKVSKALPQAAVLSAALVDSDLLELTVWQGGKRVTTRGHFPYDGTPKRGDPKKFCAALGLPDEDVPRLKAVWAKGNAEEQLVLTAALLGTPLYCDTRSVPEKVEKRDAAYVDQWLAQRPDPPKVKNQTRAEIVQELAGLEIPFGSEMGSNGAGCFTRFRRLEDEKYLFLRWEGEELAPARPFVPEAWLRADEWKYSITYQDLGAGRVLAIGWERKELNEWNFDSVPVGIIGDSAGTLKCPLEFVLDGNRRSACDGIYSMPDGGVLIRYESLSRPFSPSRPFYEELAPRELVRYAPDGTILWRRSLDQWKDRPWFFRGGLLWMENSDRPDEEKYYALDLDGREALTLSLPPLPEEEHFIFNYHMPKRQPVEGEVWVLRTELDRRICRSKATLFRSTEQGRLLGQHPLPCDMADGISSAVLLGNRVCIDRFDEGIWVLDRKDYSVAAKIEDHRSYMGLETDGQGRIWVAVSDSTWEAYDQDLNLLSRHRLKGGTMDVGVDSEGCLRLLTYDEKNHILRVYRCKSAGA